MCFKSACPTCQKSSWKGCGSHIASVMNSIPESDRCTCEPKVESGGSSYPPMAGSGKAPETHESLGEVSGAK